MTAAMSRPGMQYRTALPSPQRRTLSVFVDAAITALLCGMFAFSGKGADASIILPCLAIFYYYLVQTALTPDVLFKGIPTVITPQLLFLIFTYLLFMYPYQLHVLGLFDIGSTHRNAFVNETNPSIILTTLGVVGFCIGSRHRFRIRSTQHAMMTSSRRSELLPLITAVMLLLSIVAFMATGGAAWFSGAYNRRAMAADTASNLVIIVTIFAMLSSAFFMVHLADRRLNLPVLIGGALAGIWTLLLLIIGDRNTFFEIALVFIGGYAAFIRRIRLPLVLLSFVGAIMLYNAMEFARTSEDRSFNALVEAVLTGSNDDESLAEGSFANTTVGSRAAISVVERKGLNAGKYKLVGISGIVPFSRRLLIDPNEVDLTSSYALTREVLGPGATWAMGSNVYSDVYLDFGFIGTFISLWFLGLVISWLRARAVDRPWSVDDRAIYLLTLGLFAEAPRYTYDFAARTLIWGALFLWLVRRAFPSVNTAPTDGDLAVHGFKRVVRTRSKV